VTRGARETEWAERLRALVSEARAAGGLGRLAPLLRAALAESAEGPAPDAGEAAGGADGFPRRYGIVGDSPAIRAVFALLDKVVASDVPVLIQGETGTGKELVARALHEHGARRDAPFLAENCAAVPANLLESELFGHVKGAFTGAVSDRRGHFTAARGGTVFLDEIGDMPLEMQAKLLRVLQDGEVRPVGSDRSERVDVRVVAASNKDLRALAGEGGFREDLFFRLNVIAIELPPLRAREGDVRHLARFFAARAASASGREVPRIAPEALDALERWSWPGNVRELENELLRAVALTRGEIGPSDLSPRITRAI